MPYNLPKPAFMCATIHATNCMQSIEQKFIPSEKQHQVYMNLALNLKAIIGQRLIPLEAGKGRAAAIEVMLNSSTVADYILNKLLIRLEKQ